MCQLYNSPKGFCIAFCRWHAPPRLDTIWNCSHYPYLKKKKRKRKKEKEKGMRHSSRLGLWTEVWRKTPNVEAFIDESLLDSNGTIRVHIGDSIGS